MDEMQQGVVAESPTADPVSPVPDPSAQGSTPPNGFDPSQQHVPYLRFKEINDRYQTERQSWLQEQQQWRQERQQYLQAMQGFQRQPQRAPSPSVQLSQDEMQAGAAVMRLLEHHPGLQPLFQLMRVAPHLAQGYGSIQSLQQRAEQAAVQSGQAEIHRLVQSANLPTAPQAMRYYEGLVAEAIRHMPDGAQRWNSGDTSVIADAWRGVQDFLSGFQRPGPQAMPRVPVQNLPPRPRGSAPGAPLPPQLNRDTDPREIRKNMFADMAKVMHRGGGG